MTITEPTLRTVDGACHHDCPDSCGWTATVEANRPLTGPEAREDIRELELRLPAALEAEVDV